MKKEKIWPERYQPHQTLFDNSASGYTTLIRKVSAFVYHPKLHSFNYHCQCRNKYFLGYLSWILGSLWTTPLPSRATPSSLVDNIKTFRRYSNSILYTPLFFFLTERKQGKATRKSVKQDEKYLNLSLFLFCSYSYDIQCVPWALVYCNNNIVRYPINIEYRAFNSSRNLLPRRKINAKKCELLHPSTWGVLPKTM